MSAILPSTLQSASMRACASAPPLQVVLGPYRLQVQFLEKSQMHDRRRLACVNVEDGRIELRRDLQGMRLAEAFFESIIRLSHFSKGCQQGCVEEAYTHSFATGLVEFAHRNPAAWMWFNLLLSEHLSSGARYDRVVDGTFAPPPKMPKRILVGGHPVTIRSITKTESGNAFGWYHFSRQEAMLYRGLTGSNLAVVALHELTHAVHHMYDIKQRDKHGNFRHAQLKGWLRIMKDNPSAWRWLAWVISFPAEASLEPRRPTAKPLLPLTARSQAARPALALASRRG
ncbi:hypothetical protein [Piscinibacter sp.]|uniref:hypothetical protein n=1 Tax=Piscinibacter sp. TaxID=1903157 RepID=UPI002C00BF53|nr:hypothetical protein [Albitalea sp.]HUG22626.1 hypothetical protein [Albitalea sp.]